MFRPLRRFRQLMPENEAYDMLSSASTGVLALSGDDGYPYAVPVNFVLDGEKIYIHGAKAGHKMDSVRKYDKASFCVVGEDTVVPERFTTHYRSVICFGRVREVRDDETKLRAVIALADKYSPGMPEERDREIEREWPGLGVIEFTIEHITAKESTELMEERIKNGK